MKPLSQYGTSSQPCSPAPLRSSQEFLSFFKNRLISVKWP